MNHSLAKAMCNEIVGMYVSGQLTDKEYRQMLNDVFHKFSIHRSANDKTTE